MKWDRVISRVRRADLHLILFPHYLLLFLAVSYVSNARLAVAEASGPLPLAINWC